MAELRPDIRVWISGSGPYESTLRNLAEKLGVADRIKIEGIPMQERERMATALSEVKVVVSLSEFEAQGIAVLEAISRGCRAIVADAPGLRSLAERGLARAIPLTSSPQEIAAAVIEELEMPTPAEPPDLPTWDDCASALLELYESVAPAHSSIS
jgi:glycosyltransferase involved in cell wall biosynthesis